MSEEMLMSYLGDIQSLTERIQEDTLDDATLRQIKAYAVVLLNTINNKKTR